MPARTEALRVAVTALEPFAKIADAYHCAHVKRVKDHRDEGRQPGPPLSDGHRISVSLGEVRAARIALASIAEIEAAVPPDDEALVECVAQIIDPEAWGLPPYDLGEFGATDRDEARIKARAAIAAMPPPQDGWRPIAEAPRDGNEVLLLHRYHRHGNSQIVAFWDDEGNKTARWQTADGPAYHEEWPSHWMPLPPPPASEPGGTQLEPCDMNIYEEAEISRKEEQILFLEKACNEQAAETVKAVGELRLEIARLRAGLREALRALEEIADMEGREFMTDSRFVVQALSLANGLARLRALLPPEE